MEYFGGATQYDAGPPQPRLSGQSAPHPQRWSEFSDNFFNCSHLLFVCCFFCSSWSPILDSRIVRRSWERVRGGLTSRWLFLRGRIFSVLGSGPSCPAVKKRLTEAPLRPP